MLLSSCTAEEGPLPNPVGEFADRAGFSVAISGDALISGARWSDFIIDEAGKALVYRLDGTTWDYEATLLPENDPSQAQSGLFGERVDIGGDRAIIGAPGEVNNFAHSGAAYIFEWDGAHWDKAVRLVAWDASTETFGNAVAISGDYAVVGQPRYPYFGGLSYGPGRVFVFHRTPGSGRWRRDAILTADDGSDGDEFGYSVSLAGDTLLVGARLDDDLGQNAGSAYLFRRRGSEWVQTQKLTASAFPDPEPLFGTSVSISSDLAVIGAAGDQQGATPLNQGAAYVFEREAGSGWAPDAKLVAIDGSPGDQFGFSVGTDGANIIVGAWLADGLASTTGAAYVYEQTGPADAWALAVKLMAEDGAYGDGFGASVDISGNCAVVGAPNWDEPGGPDFVGATYVFCNLPDDVTADVDVIVSCCEQDSEPEARINFTLHYTGRGERRPILTRWVELTAPDGRVETILYPETLFPPVDATLDESVTAYLGREPLPGAYRLTTYWKEASGLVQSLKQTFQSN